MVTILRVYSSATFNYYRYSILIYSILFVISLKFTSVMYVDLKISHPHRTHQVQQGIIRLAPASSSRYVLRSKGVHVMLSIQQRGYLSKNKISGTAPDCLLAWGSNSCCLLPVACCQSFSCSRGIYCGIDCGMCAPPFWHILRILIYYSSDALALSAVHPISSPLGWRTILR